MADTADLVFRFKWTSAGVPREAELHMANITPKDSRMVRQATGLPLEAFVGSIGSMSTAGLDTVCVLLWLARMKAGEPKLTLDRVESGFSYANVPEVEVVTPDDDSEDPTIRGNGDEPG